MAGRALADYGRLLDVITVEAEALAVSAQATRPDAPVPTCPGLTAGETVRHVGSVYRMVLAWLRSGSRPESWPRDPEPGVPVLDWLRDGARDLAGELAAHEPDEPGPTWWEADQTYGFWRRRMAHETTVHRVDLRIASGAGAGEIADEVALDGVDEVLTLWFTHRLRVLGVAGTREGSVAVRAGDQVWITRAGMWGTSAWRAREDEARRADSQVSASPAQLYLWLWGRAPYSSARMDGDVDAAAQLWALLRLATR